MKGENNNPIPSKRRTVQGQSHILSNSNSSSNLNSFTNLNKPLAPVISHNSPEPESKESTIILDPKNENDKENVLLQQATRKSINVNLNNNEDEMQKIVAYMNKFEKESIKTVDPTSTLEAVEIDPLSQDNLIPSATTQQELINSFNDIPSIEEPSKLRLSSSSLSSSEESLNENNNSSNTNNNIVQNDYDDISNTPITTTTFKIASNESETMVVTTQNLNSILSPSNKLPESQIDRRTYIVNKIYDNFSDETQKKFNKDDEQYEKVIIKHNVVEDSNEYDNDLLIKPENNFVKTQVEEHIYVNVNDLDKNVNNSDSVIRESLGFDVEKYKISTNHYENGLELNIKEEESNIEESTKQKDKENRNTKIESSNTFDSELVEINQQINNLLKSNEKEQEFNQDQSNQKENNDNLMNTQNTPPVTLRSKSISTSKSNSIDELKSSNNANNQTQINNANINTTNKRNSFRVKTNNNNNNNNNNNSNEILTNNNNKVNMINNTKNINDLNNPKRKSSICFDELKRRKSDNINDNINTNNNSNTNINSNNSKQQAPIMPKYRQSISTTTTPTTDSTSTINTNLNKVNLKNLSKSLQDNSKLIKNELKVQNIDIQSNQSPSITIVNNKSANLKQIAPKLVNLDLNVSKSENQILHINNQDDKPNVKTKIKLMESIVNSNSSNTIQTTNSSSSKSTKNDYRSASSSSSASSASSSRSPPSLSRSPHISKQSTEAIEAKPYQLVTTKVPPTVVARSNTIQFSHNAPSSNQSPALAPRPIIKQKENIDTTSAKLKDEHQVVATSSSSESVNNIMQENVLYSSENLNEDKVNNTKTDTNDNNTFNLKHNSLSNLKEKRQTVKELMSKFEPK